MSQYVFRGHDHPAANGRQPLANEEQFQLFFKTDDGGKVTIQLGRKGFVNIMSCVLCGLRDDPALYKEIVDAMDDVDSSGSLEFNVRKK